MNLNEDEIIKYKYKLHFNPQYMKAKPLYFKWSEDALNNAYDIINDWIDKQSTCGWNVCSYIKENTNMSFIEVVAPLRRERNVSPDMIHESWFCMIEYV